MAFLDIDEIPELMSRSIFSSYNRFNWAAFCERDHFGDPHESLRRRLSRDASAHGLSLPPGRIFLLTHLRYLGYNFNPISLFYCYGQSGELEMVMAEVNNTFGGRKNYWIANPKRFRCAKQMHVSPFNKMELDYEFVLTDPGDSLVVHMNTLDGGQHFFDATLSLYRKEWSAKSLLLMLLRFPWMTAKVIAAIHWEALRLYLKKAPVYKHP